METAPTAERRLISVHAHPDDEASKGASTVHRYAREGVHTVLVCCTGGEAGDIHNPAMDRPEVRADLPAVRRAELDASAAIIGFHEVHMLGYLDSGMPDMPENAHPGNFANAPLEEAVGRLVGHIRRVRPQVMLTYGDDQSGYPHPDHLRVHEVSMAALTAAADPTAYPGLGDPWAISKVYWSVWSRRRIEAMHQAFLDHGLESPFTEEWFSRPSQDDRITTRVDVSELYDVRAAALRAHATQVDPDSPFWFGLPDEVLAGIHTHEDYIRGYSAVDAPIPEDDLFAGLG